MRRLRRCFVTLSSIDSIGEVAGHLFQHYTLESATGPRITIQVVNQQGSEPGEDLQLHSKLLGKTNGLGHTPWRWAGIFTSTKPLQLSTRCNHAALGRQVISCQHHLGTLGHDCNHPRVWVAPTSQSHSLGITTLLALRISNSGSVPSSCACDGPGPLRSSQKTCYSQHDDRTREERGHRPVDS
ncbi:uncharacterized protein EDB91DRAFT_899563 [Suillus paluster]|uniref:uncharacterized protein n=1 Tax=Suillus paluster TaxID=48578 RepID=UPI001B86BD2C|nr:uncharacterized protein EDB91DRAFT_899563 [Suillus paluster]KAG1726972.1 hypothetical protein EDB91DRAFT_899563 [Suillus paluster]